MMNRGNIRSKLSGLLLIASLLICLPLVPAVGQSELVIPKTRDTEKLGWGSRLTPTKQVKARYPGTASFRQQEGWVHLNYWVDARGSVSNVVVVESYPSDVFDDNAASAMKQWQFEIPADTSDLNFPIRQQIAFTFSQSGSGVREHIGKRLIRARNAIVEDSDYEQATRYLEEVSDRANEDWLNLYELSVLEQTYALLAFSQDDFDKAITHGERTLQFAKTLDEGNIVATRRLLFFSYFNTKQFSDAVRIYDGWVELEPDVRDSAIAPAVERLRTALKEGREIVIEQSE